VAVNALPTDLVDVVRRTDKLCLNVGNPGWDDARGYLFHEPTKTLYFPVSKKYLPDQLDDFRVLIWSQPRVLATGKLAPATSEDDVALQHALAQHAGLEPEKARYMLLDQRTKKPRRTGYKLLIRELVVAPM
jgi:hypothetical protein